MQSKNKRGGHTKKGNYNNNARILCVLLLCVQDYEFTNFETTFLYNFRHWVTIAV